MQFSDLGGILNGHIHISEDRVISHYSVDSRSLAGKSKEVFIALAGRRDGHHFISSAYQKGVRNFIVEEAPNFEKCNFIQVDDTLLALQKIATNHRKAFEIDIIGITGSNGKTIIKEWLSSILSEQKFVIKTPKSFNSQIGVPLSVLEIKPEHEIGVFEAGISTVNEMERLERVIKPDIGIFSTLGNAHGEGFASDKEKLMEKLKLFKSSREVVYREDQVYSLWIKEALKSKAVSWSLLPGAHHRVHWDKGAVILDDHTYTVDFSNESDFENVTHAIVAAMRLGMEADLIQKGLDQLKSIPMRLELKKGANGCLLLDDTYNNDLQGLRVAIDYLVSQNQNEKKTVILTDIMQSGDPDHIVYQKVNELLIEKGIHRFIGIGPTLSSLGPTFTMKCQVFESVEEFLNDLPTFEKETILLKGARVFALERVVKRLELHIHGTRLEVNLEALGHNLNEYRNLLTPETKLMVMVKANAYGCGLLEVANYLQRRDVDRLGVAYVSEAIELRKNGIHLPIMIMNPHIDSFHDFEKYGLEAEIFSISHFDHYLATTSNPPPIHIKIDTGMRRLGFSKEDLPMLIHRLVSNPQIKVEGIFTHFAASDQPGQDSFTKEQVEEFHHIYESLVECLGYRPLKHASNSAAISRLPAYHYDMVRLGIGLYGFDPTYRQKLRTVCKLKSTISQLRRLKEKTTIGYGREGKMDPDSTVAVLPIGYEDGFLRVFGNGTAKLNVASTLCPTIGNICMDMTMIDVTNTEAKEGDEVIIFGEKPTLKEVAEWAGTIPYETLTNIGSRVKRVYVWD